MEGSLENVALADLPDTIGAPPSARLIESVERQGIIQPVLLAEHTTDTGEIQLLALMEACTSDTQAAYGRGRVDTDSAANVDATDVSTAKWRGHVGLWGNVWQMVDGIDVATTGKLRLFKNDGTEEWSYTVFMCPAYDGTNAASMQL